jgi:hypothetical protein
MEHCRRCNHHVSYEIREKLDEVAVSLGVAACDTFTL